MYLSTLKNVFVHLEHVFVHIAKCICPPCKMYLSTLKMYLSTLQNVFVHLAKCICPVSPLSTLPLCWSAKPVNPGGHSSLSNCQNQSKNMPHHRVKQGRTKKYIDKQNHKSFPAKGENILPSYSWIWRSRLDEWNRIVPTDNRRALDER